MNITKRIAVIAFSLAVIATIPGQALAAKPETASQSNKPKTEQNSQAEPKPATEPAPQPKVVTVQSGDYLEKIATENQSTSLRLFYANPGVANPDLIYPNQKLRVPTAEEALAPREVPVNQTIASPTPAASTQAAASAASARPVSRPVASPAPAPSAGAGVWDRLAACEAGGNWHINTGNGFYGGLQFSLSSWRAVGGSGLPSNASRDEQIMRGQMLQARQGWGAWPACSAKLGLR